MLNVVKEKKGNALLLILTGSIEESVDFAKLFGDVAGPEVVVNSKGVARINSVGVKSWIKYFQTLAQKGIKLRWIECSTAIVEQLNLISNFSCGGVVESIFVPFSCTKCRSELVGLFGTDALKKSNFNLPELKCSKCGGKAEFDDIPEEYFNFLMS